MPSDKSKTVYRSLKSLENMEQHPFLAFYSLMRSSSKKTVSNNKTYIHEYNALLNENEPWEKQSQAFQDLYSRHKEQFEQLESLADQFSVANASWRDSPLECHKINRRKENVAARGAGFFSNIRFHLNHGDDADNRRYGNYTRSLAIGVSAPLGIAIILVGGMVLIPTMNTYLLYLPIAFIALGAILSASAMILAYVDKQEAIRTYASLEKKHQELTKQEEQLVFELCDIFDKVKSIDVESTPSSQITLP